MNKTSVELKKKRAALMEELSTIDYVVIGSFFERKVRGVKRWCLSRMVNGVQRQVYISAEHSKQIRKGVDGYKRAMEILKELGEINLEIIKRGEDNV